MPLSRTAQRMSPPSARDDQNYWQQVDDYIVEHTDVRFSHSICPECRAKHVTPEIERIRRARKGASQAPPAP